MPFLLKDADCPVGGATVEWYAWIKGLEANNIEVGLLTWKGAKRYVGNIESINLLETYDPNAGIKKLRWLNRYRVINKVIKKYNPDCIIQECAGFSTGVMASIGKRLNIPFIYRVANDIDTDERINQRLNFRSILFYRYGLKHSSAIFCQNIYQHKQVKKIFPNKKSFIIHNPFYFKGELPKLQTYSDRTYVAWVGIFQYQKNLPALYNIVKKMPDTIFKIAGRSADSRLDQITQKALQRLEKSSNVIFVGYLKRSEILPFLAKAYALLNTSHYEGFSNTFLESLAAGTPIVTSSKADPDNIVSNNNLGAVAKSFDELDSALDKIIKNNQYNALASKCREYLLLNNETNSISKQFIQLVEETI